MNIVKATNKIALITVVGLIYWVFIFVCSTVFGFKVFRENMTEIFLLSILGIFAVLSGAIVLNIMFNLTAIAEGRKAHGKNGSGKRRPWVLFSGSLVVIFALLYAGDLATAKKKEAYLVSAADALVEEQQETLVRISNYSFSREYLENASESIRILSRVEENFPSITVIIEDSIQGKDYFLGLVGHMYIDDKKEPAKVDYILSTSKEERKYLYSIFNENNRAHRFSSNDGHYEMYYPVKTEKGTMVLYFSQYNRHGKFGS